MVAKTKLSQLARIRVIAVLIVLRMMVVIVVVILTESFIQCISTIAAPLTLMLKTSSLTDFSTSAAKLVVKYDKFDDIR